MKSTKEFGSVSPSVGSLQHTSLKNNTHNQSMKIKN
jgi:hypothetical protein